MEYLKNNISDFFRKLFKTKSLKEKGRLVVKRRGKDFTFELNQYYLKIIVRFLFFILLFLFFLNIAYALEISGIVMRVLDGDTIHFLPDKKIAHLKMHKDNTVSIRFRGIDAPEKDQPYGLESKENLKRMIENKRVVIDVKDIDRYGRIAGYVYFNNININLEQIKHGFAWAYTEYLDRPYVSEFYDAEKQARKNRFGLWKQLNPIPPWEWRKLKKN